MLCACFFIVVVILLTVAFFCVLCSLLAVDCADVFCNADALGATGLRAERVSHLTHTAAEYNQLRQALVRNTL